MSDPDIAGDALPHDGGGGGPAPAALPVLGTPALRFAVRLAAPDLRPWLAGNAGGLPGVWSFAADAPGPHVVVSAILHGNEVAGGVVLARWLEAGAPRPLRGRLTLVFANLDAHARFDPAEPTLSRYVDEDMNRLWDEATLDGPRTSSELRRARALRPVLDSADVLLDLHSMLWPSDPLILCGRAAKARALAARLGVPPLVVADDGHADGRRMMDYRPFADPAHRAVALLVEGGPHWEPETPPVLEACARALLRATGLLAPAAAAGDGDGATPAASAAPSVWEVTRTVVARTRGFAFVRPYRGGEVVPRRGTLIALDGDPDGEAEEVRTAHDDTLLVMPSPQILRGHTAVRLARRAATADQAEPVRR